MTYNNKLKKYWVILMTKKRSILSQRLLKLREDQKWPKSYVAEQLGKQLSTYANWEYGIREPDSITLLQIANLYNVSVDYLLGNTINPHPPQEKEYKEFVEFINSIKNVELRRWASEFTKNTEEDLEKLYAMWKIINSNKAE